VRTLAPADLPAVARLGGLPCSNALLTSGDETETRFEEALERYGPERPFERARTELAFGEMLPRNLNLARAAGY
jgi:hypothetical protein